jgi:hypothetical protein
MLVTHGIHAAYRDSRKRTQCPTAVCSSIGLPNGWPSECCLPSACPVSERMSTRHSPGIKACLCLNMDC